MKKKSKKTIEKEKHKKWREKVLERDNHKCQICKRTEGKLDVHHIIPKQFKEFKYDVKNGIVLCFRHHKMGGFSVHQNALFFCAFLVEHKRSQCKYLLTKLYELDYDEKQRQANNKKRPQAKKKKSSV